MYLKKDSKGLTLIELIVVIGIIAILAAVAVPGIMRWVPNYRLKGAARDLVSSIQRARLEAVKRNVNATVTFSPGTYDPAGQVGSYQVFIDDGSGGGTAGDSIRNGSEPVIVLAGMPKNVSLINNNPLDPPGFPGNLTIFNPLGMATPWGNVQLRNNQSRWYKMTITSAGSVRLEISGDGTTWQ